MFRHSRIRALAIACLLIACELSSVVAQSAGAPICVACDRSPPNIQFWRHTLGLVCNDCKELNRSCWICGLPAHADYKETKDGRIICRREAPYAVVDVEAVKQTFETTRASVSRMTRGFMKLKNTKVSVQVYDFDYWNSNTARGKIKSNAGALHRMGLALSRPAGDGFYHNVMLVSGQVNTNLIGVCAHEFTHLWINENKPAEHAIEPQTVEAICELVAYKHAETNRRAAYQKQIEENSYTEGRVNELIPHLDRYGLTTILRWVAIGKGTTITADELARVQGVAFSGASAGSRSASGHVASPIPDQPTDSPLFASGAKMTKPAATTLKLKGIVGDMALINGKAFRVGDTKTFQIGDKKVIVKCEKITPSSVQVRVDGGEMLQTLTPQ